MACQPHAMLQGRWEIEPYHAQFHQVPFKAKKFVPYFLRYGHERRILQNKTMYIR